MAVSLKLISQQEEEKTIQALKLIAEGGVEADLKTANKEGLSLDEATFTRLKTLVTLGQRYEEIIESQKSEFTDI